MSDPLDDPKMKAYLRHAKEEMFPKLKGSALSITILKGDPDPKLCLELGAAILFDKPLIILVVDPEMPVPANLKRCASAIVYGNPSDDATQKRLEEAVYSVLANDKRSKP
jgi:hypothetical protein